MEATREFYEDVLGFPLVRADLVDIVGKGTMRHYFFDVGNGQLIGFMSGEDVQGFPNGLRLQHQQGPRAPAGRLPLRVRRRVGERSRAHQAPPGLERRRGERSRQPRGLVEVDLLPRSERPAARGLPPAPPVRRRRRGPARPLPPRGAPQDGARKRGAVSSADGLLERVRAVVPLVAERAADAEQKRKPDDDVIEALKATGVFRSFVPKRFGGYEIDLELFLDIGVAVSEACASTGWITTFYMEHNWLLRMFAPELQAEIFSRQPYVLAPGSVNPNDGNATPKGDGYELTGHWRFGTGHRARRLGAALGPDRAPSPGDAAHVPGAARRGRGARHLARRRHGGDGQPRHRRERGLRARAPGDAAADDGVGPAGDDYLGRIPVPPMLSLTAAIPSVGAARRAVELYRTLLAERVPFGTKKTQSHRAPVAGPPRARARRRARRRDGAALGRARAHGARARRPAALAHGPDPDAPHDRARGPRLPRRSCAT